MSSATTSTSPESSTDTEPTRPRAAALRSAGLARGLAYAAFLGIGCFARANAAPEPPAPTGPPAPAIPAPPAPAPAIPTPLRKPGPVAPENLSLWDSVCTPEQVAWMQEQRLRVFGWMNGGYTWSETGDGLLRVAPRANRFGDEWLLNQFALVVERTLDPSAWSWGGRAEFYCGADAALLRPLNGFGPDDNPRFGTDLRQLFAAVHIPALSEGGIDLRAGRIYVPIGYESTMSPYRPMYSAAYAWLYTQTGAATGGTATWHVHPRLDVIGGITLGYNTFFELRGDGPSYITRALYWWNDRKQTKLVGTAYTGPQPIATARGHVAEWQTVIEGQVVHDWSPRFTQAFELNFGWDVDAPVTGGTSEWFGGYSVGILHLHPEWDLNLRAEVFADQDGSRTSVGTTYGEFTVGFNYMPRPWLNFRPEVRWDVADTPVFGPTQVADREREQLTLAFDCLVKF